MTIISFFCFLICLLIIGSTFIKTADALSPARVFGFIWFSSIGLTDLKLSAYQYDWNLVSWICLSIGPSAFLLGIFITYVLNIRSNLIPVNTMRSTLKKQYVDQDRLFKAICIGFSLFFISFIVSFLVKGTVPLFVFNNTTVSRTEFGVFGVGILVHSLPFTLFFTTLYHIIVENNIVKKRILKILSMIMLIAFITLLFRFPLILVIIACFTLIYYSTRRIKIRTIVLFFLIIVGIFYLSSTLRTGEILQTYIYRMSKMRYGKEFMLFTEPYMYIVMNLENYAHAVERLESFTYGYYTFDFLLALGGIKHLIGDYFRLSYTTSLESAYNGYTAFWTYYRDFGIIGTFIIPLLLGLCIGSTYYSLRIRPTIKKISAYSIMVFIMVISYFLTPLGFLWFAYNAIAMYVILWWICYEPKRISLQSNTQTT